MTFEELEASLSRILKRTPDEAILMRMVTAFAPQIDKMDSANDALLEEYYVKIVTAPATGTKARIQELTGLTFNGVFGEKVYTSLGR